MLKLACSVLAVYLTANLVAGEKSTNSQPSATLLATVGKQTITEADLQLQAAIAYDALPEDGPDRDEARKRILEQLIEKRLIQQFLRQQKIAAEPEELSSQVNQVKELIRKRKGEPEELLKRLGLTDDKLQDQLGLPLAWSKYCRKTITEDQILGYYQQHQSELDGTKLRAAQIVLKLTPNVTEQEVEKRKQRLKELREDILAKKISFAEAARKHSEAPTQVAGGDVGWFPFRGKMPVFFGDVAFSLKPGEISAPVVSPFGVHLIQVTDKQAGELTVEESRPEIVQRLSQKLWIESVAEERKRTPVEVK